MDITKQCKNYIVQSICLVVLLNVCCSLSAKFWGYGLLAAQIVGTVFVLVLEITAALVWRWVALKHRDMLPSFFTAVSGFRFLGALLVMAVWYLVVGSENIMTFLVVFLVFYMVTLLHHSIIFSRVSNGL